MAKLLNYIDERSLTGVSRMVSPAQFSVGAAIIVAGLITLADKLA